MSIQLDEKSYVLGHWFVTHNPNVPVTERVDWMACIYREKDEPTEPWQLKYRFRYHGPDPDPFSSEDRKSWYEGTMPPDVPIETILESAHGVAKMVAERIGTKVDFFEVRGGSEKFIEIMRTRDWANAIEMPKMPWDKP